MDIEQYSIGCPPPFKIGQNLARKVLKTVLENSQNHGGNIYTQNVKNAFYLAKSVVKNQTFCQMLCSVRIFNAFYTIRNLRLPFSNANSEAGM